MTEPGFALKTERLSRSFGEVRAVRDVSFSVYEGEIFALLGVNGAGKTTLIRMLTGLLLPDAGTAEVAGHPIGSREGRALLGLSPQESAVAGNLTVRENLTLIAEIYGTENPGRAVDETIVRLGLGEYENRRAKTLSGGWKRRLSIGMGIVQKPRLLFLDEPTLGLDVLARRELWRAVETLKEDMTVVLTTHYMEEAEQLSDRIGIMERGELLTVGTLAEIKAAAGCAPEDSLETAFVKLAERGTVG